jgi:hypothetical protein
VLRCPSNRIFVSGAAGPTNSLMEHTSSALDPLSAHHRGDGRPSVAASRTDADRGLDLFLGAIVDSFTGGCLDLEVGAGVPANSMWFVRHRVIDRRCRFRTRGTRRVDVDRLVLP